MTKTNKKKAMVNDDVRELYNILNERRNRLLAQLMDTEHDIGLIENRMSWRPLGLSKY